MKISAVVESCRAEVRIAMDNYGAEGNTDVPIAVRNRLDRSSNNSRQYEYNRLDSNNLYWNNTRRNSRDRTGGRNPHERHYMFNLEGRGIPLEVLQSEAAFLTWLRPRLYEHETTHLDGNKPIYFFGAKVPLPRPQYDDNFHGEHWFMRLGRMHICNLPYLHYINDFKPPRPKPEEFFTEWSNIVSGGLKRREERLKTRLEERRKQLLNMQRSYGQTAMLAKLATNGMEAYLRNMVDNMKAIPGVVKLDLVGTAIELTTEPFWVDACDQRWFLGAFALQIDMRGSITYRSLHKTTENGFFHPHGGTMPCLGGFHELLGNAYTMFDFATVANVAIEFLRSFNEADGISRTNLTTNFGHVETPLRDPLPDFIGFFSTPNTAEDEGEDDDEDDD